MYFATKHLQKFGTHKDAMDSTSWSGLKGTNCREKTLTRSKNESTSKKKLESSAVEKMQKTHVQRPEAPNNTLCYAKPGELQCMHLHGTGVWSRSRHSISGKSEVVYSV